MSPRDTLVRCGAMSANLHFGVDLLDPDDPELHAEVGDGLVLFTRRDRLMVGWAAITDHRGAWMMSRSGDVMEISHFVRGQLCHVERSHTEE